MNVLCRIKGHKWAWAARDASGRYDIKPWTFERFLRLRNDYTIDEVCQRCGQTLTPSVFATYAVIEGERERAAADRARARVGGTNG